MDDGGNTGADAEDDSCRLPAGKGLEVADRLVDERSEARMFRRRMRVGLRCRGRVGEGSCDRLGSECFGSGLLRARGGRSSQHRDQRNGMKRFASHEASPLRLFGVPCRVPRDARVFLDDIISQLIAEPDPLDARIDRGQRQRDESADDSRQLGAYGERQQHRDVAEAEAIAIHVGPDEIVLDQVIEEINRDEQERDRARHAGCHDHGSQRDEEPENRNEVTDEGDRLEDQRPRHLEERERDEDVISPRKSR